MSSKTKENPGCLSFFTNLFGGNRAAQQLTVEIVPAEPEVLPYRVRDDFLSPTELSFYRVLRTVIGARATIFTKVGLADVFYVTRPNENQSYRNRIVQKHVDFVVCDAQTVKPLFAVELDDASHQRTDRQERDEFVDLVFQNANLPLVHVIAQREYSVQELAAKIEAYLPIKTEVKTQAVATPTTQPQLVSSATVQPVNTSSVTPTSTAPLCPKCGIPMVVRTVAQGEHKGKQFYGCTNYPRCREMKPLR